MPTGGRPETGFFRGHYGKIHKKGLVMDVANLWDGAWSDLEEIIESEAAATPEVIPDIIEWSEKYIILPTGNHIEFFSHQKRIFNEAFRFDPDTGKLPYSTIVFSCPKKSGKTALNAVVMAFWLFNVEPPNEIICAANKRDQAISRGFHEAKGYIERTPALAAQTARVTDKSIELKNGSTILAVPNDFSGEAGSNHGLTTWDELWGFCESQNTEIYTKNGWRSFIDLQIGEEVACWDEGRFIWQPVQMINKFWFDGDLVRLTHRRAKMQVTPNHRVLGKFRTSGHQKLQDQPWGILEAREVMDMYEGLVPTGAESWDGVCAEKILGQPSMPMMTILGYWVAEGHLAGNRVMIGQEETPNPEAVDEIECALRETSYEWRYNGHIFTIYDKDLKNYLSPYQSEPNKRIPNDLKDLSKPLLSKFLSGYLSGDGWIAGLGYQCETTSAGLREDLCEIGVKCGWTVRYMGSRKREPHYHHIYRISFSKGSVCYHRKNWSFEPYKGVVWCPTVKSGVWLANNDGYIYWTGNSTERDQRFYDELTPVPTRLNSVRFISTYAGFEGESTLLENLYYQIFNSNKTLREEGIGRPLGEDFPVYTKGRLFMYWDHEARLPWQTPEYYAEQEHEVRPNTFLRFHKNYWVSSEGGLFDMEDWDDCVDETHSPPLPDRSTMLFVGVDASVKKDRSAVVSVYRQGDKVMLGPKRFWQPTHDDPMDLEETMEAFLLELQAEYTLLSVKYDPFQFHRSATTLQKEGLPMEEYPQTGGNLTEMGQNIYDLVTYKNIVLYPCRHMRYEATCSIAKETGRGLRLTKEKSTQKIDQIVALAMAALKGSKTSSAFGDCAIP